MARKTSSFLSDRDVLLTRAEAAQYLRRSISSMEKWSQVGEGPPTRIVGRRVLYPLVELRRFVEAKPARVPTLKRPSTHSI
jgi:hypothetical protein